LPQKLASFSDMSSINQCNSFVSQSLKRQPSVLSIRKIKDVQNNRRQDVALQN